MQTIATDVPVAWFVCNVPCKVAALRDVTFVVAQGTLLDRRSDEFDAAFTKLLKPLAIYTLCIYREVVQRSLSSGYRR